MNKNIIESNLTLKSVWNGLVSASPFKSSPQKGSGPSDDDIKSGIPLPSQSSPTTTSETTAATTAATNTTTAQSQSQSTQQQLFMIGNSHRTSSPTRRVGLGMLSQYNNSEHQSATHLWQTAIPKPAEDYAEKGNQFERNLDNAVAPISSLALEDDLNLDYDDLSKVEYGGQLLDDEEPLQLAEDADDMLSEKQLINEPMLEEECEDAVAVPSHHTTSVYLSHHHTSTPSKQHTTLIDSLDLDAMKSIAPLIEINTPSAAPPTITSNSVPIAEFDPLIPKDWMMSFDSPAPLLKSESAYSINVAKNATTPSSRTDLKKNGSLLDSFDPTSPKSTLLYSQKDLDVLRAQLQEKFEQEIQLSTQEISDLTLANQTLFAENLKIKSTLSDWERAVHKMIAEREKEKTGSRELSSRLQTDLDESRANEILLRKELDTITTKWKQLRLDHSDLVEASETSKTLSKSLQASLEASQTRFETLKLHAESKLSHANVEIARVRAGFEKDTLALRTKLSRLEASLNTTTRSLEAKSRECEELVRICDALEKQLVLE